MTQGTNKPLEPRVLGENESVKKQRMNIIYLLPHKSPEIPHYLVSKTTQFNLLEKQSVVSYHLLLCT
jgi:hypothetical protein